MMIKLCLKGSEPLFTLQLTFIECLLCEGVILGAEDLEVKLAYSLAGADMEK